MINYAPRARELFLDDTNVYGCAEVTLIVLQEALDLPDAADSSAAMALNGGIAYSGGTCGAITGAALAAGRLAGRCLADHSEAKREARRLVQDLMAGFRAEFGSADCRHLTGYDLAAPGQHETFIADGTWRVNCTRQIEYAVEHMARLIREAGWASPPASGPPATPLAPEG